MNSNKYMGRGYAELEELRIDFEYRLLDAQDRKDFAQASNYVHELALIQQAMRAYERGE
ncbi:hypothetical protein [Terrihalobacillus insolitus]|uniref:hypothetical protein n=1 Tax=Terrihalobacillus insolitus TaxID=2950438 RepID=UPI00234048B8|nr:hypothetical protein [Terrihalobacillus insolitus]MDC3413944.1 hypothetical protein [Terrihalobacillus insolitus]